ncbi:sigma-70 family RNA polymerase sigma factor [Aporhodopirellula aestuarii]|uniref:Sigma-70 family RNA polymerase sigma factor n=1 Tax=Aporhodopirellula aestuarii TaxID=2950107 RepID=A0ABT0TZ57_9BACT|nr:sigma-70 family RNA polymerase sigma factor [Aporhodopirellula aestuarii]MCM2369837.1 sigma-70 family RNA polymerase sigma factor [Aporhodopirellula aestuarii]
MATTDSRQQQAEFVRLLSANHRRIQTFIQTLLPDRDLAEDVMQNTSVVMWQKFQQYESGSDFTAWAFRIARYEVLSLTRIRGKVRMIFDESLCEEIADDVERRSGNMDVRMQILNECLSSLNVKDSELLKRRYEEGATIKSVAEAVGRPIEGMYKAMSRIHRTLFECTRRKLSAAE